MSTAALPLGRDAMLPRPPDGRRLGFALALLVHLLLIAALAFSVNWRMREPEAVSAELWSAVPQVAAPRAVSPPPAPPPAVRPQPVPVPEKPVPPPPRPTADPRVDDAQIAIEKARREAAKRETEAREEQRREERQRELQKAEAQKQAQQRAAEQATARKEAERLEARKEKAEREKAAAAEARRDELKREQLAKEAEARKQKELAERARKEEAQVLAQREAYLKRIQGQAGATGDEGSTGSAARSSGPSASYAGRIKARIKPNIVLTDTVEGNPVASIEVRCAPDGTIVSRKVVRSSGSPTWDAVVLRAIDRTEVLPRDVDGRVPAVMHIDFKPRD